LFVGVVNFRLKVREFLKLIWLKNVAYNFSLIKKFRPATAETTGKSSRKGYITEVEIELIQFLKTR
jgi:hypothetical protein